MIQSFLVALALLASDAPPMPDARPGVLSAGQLAEECQATSSEARSDCSKELAAAMSFLTSGGFSGTPPPASCPWHTLSEAKVSKLLVDYVHFHPEVKGKAATIAVLFVVADAIPC